MTTVIGVKFKNNNKTYFFDPLDIPFKKGEFAVVETARGVEFGSVAMGRCEVEDSAVVHPLKPVVRKATDADIAKNEANLQKEREAYPVARKKISERELEMKLVDVEYAFDGSKIIFYFTADGRIDFRELVKDLASVFKNRIELRQIGVRDESKMLGGLGICGCPLCCSRFLEDFQPVSIKMAKEQGLSLNPAKISGTCGRLMCCLKYEQAAYEDLLSRTPHHGCIVETPEGRGKVVESYPLTGVVKVSMAAAPDALPKTFNRDQLTIISGKPAAKPAESAEK